MNLFHWTNIITSQIGFISVCVVFGIYIFNVNKYKAEIIMERSMKIFLILILMLTILIEALLVIDIIKGDFAKQKSVIPIGYQSFIAFLFLPYGFSHNKEYIFYGFHKFKKNSCELVLINKNNTTQLNRIKLKSGKKKATLLLRETNYNLLRSMIKK